MAAAQTLAAETRPSAFLLLSNSPDRNLERVSKFCPRNSSNVDPRPHLSLLHFTLWKVCVFTPSFGAKPQKFKRDAFALPSLARPLSPSLSLPTSRAFCSVGTAAKTRGDGRLARGRRASVSAPERPAIKDVGKAAQRLEPKRRSGQQILRNSPLPDRCLLNVPADAWNKSKSGREKFLV